MVVLAKSSRGDTKISLRAHTEDVLNAFESLFGTAEEPSRLGNRWCAFFQIENPEAFHTNGRIACIMHDLGKANSGFQAAVSGDPDGQLIWHEHLSGLLINSQTASEALLQVPDAETEVILAAVIGHHLRASHKDFADNLNANRSRFQLIFSGIEESLGLARDMLGMETEWLQKVPTQWGFGSKNAQDVLASADSLRQRLKKFKRSKWKEPPIQRLLVAVRAALIVADSAGSGLVRLGEYTGRTALIQQWLKNSFNQSLVLDGGDINEKVISPRKEQLNEQFAATDRPPFEWADFQIAAGKLSSRALLLAGCGSGKTLAAWRWIQAQADRSSVSRVIFLYPTRATATEGFRDYVSWAPEAAMIHGTSSYELDDMFTNHDPRSKRDFTTDDRLFAIGYWQRQIFSATVDQFLGFMQHSYRSICLLPMLVDSVIVIDEVHSFDKSLFSALRRFLQAFDVPVLCMTASLPNERKRVLEEECGLEVFPKSPDQFEDLRERSAMPRYAVCGCGGEDEASAIAQRKLGENKRVLWVVNTVDRCQQLARRLDAICYHSRFTLDDRKDRHQDVVDRFKKATGPVLAITTQVCEMSLDLDAHVLITETAPIPSLIQRMGRCNRHATPTNPSIGQVYFYPAENTLPYNAEDLVGLESFLTAIDGQAVGQDRLQQLLEQYGSEETEVERYAAFLESGPWAQSREATLRDETNFSVQAILDRDVEEYLCARRTRQPSDGFILPVPRSMATADERLPRWLHTVCATKYDERLGLEKRP